MSVASRVGRYLRAKSASRSSAALLRGAHSAYKHRKVIKKAATTLKRRWSGKSTTGRRVRAKPSYNLGPTNHSSVKCQSVYVGLREPKNNRKSYGFNYSATQSVVMGSTAGTQGYNLIAGMLTPSQDLTSTGTTFDARSQAYADLFDINPFGKTTGSALLPATMMAEDSIHVKTLKSFVSLRNMTSVDCVVDLYVVSAKKNTNRFPDGAWQTGLINQGGGLAVNVGPTPGRTDGDTIGYADIRNIGFTPTMSVEFNKLYKIHKVVKVEMAAGASENINIHVGVHKDLKKGELTDYLSNGICGVGGQTVFVFGMVRAGLVFDQTNVGGVAQHVPTYGIGEVAAVITTRYHMTAVPMSKRAPIETYVTRVPGNATVANLENINEVDDLDQERIA